MIELKKNTEVQTSKKKYLNKNSCKLLFYKSKKKLFFTLKVIKYILKLWYKSTKVRVTRFIWIKFEIYVYFLTNFYYISVKIVE